MPKIIIDGTDFEADEGLTVLQVIRANGISIPRSVIMKPSNRLGPVSCVGLKFEGEPENRESCFPVF